MNKKTGTTMKRQQWTPPSKKESPTTCQGFDAACGNVKAKWARVGSAFHEDWRNWGYLCSKCLIAANEYWKEMWEEYWSGRW